MKLAAVLLVWPLVPAVMAQGNKADSKPAQGSKPAAKPTPPAQPSVTYLGDAVLGGGVAISALGVEDPTDGGEFNKPKAGKKFVSVFVLVVNAEKENLDVNLFNATLVDQTGTIHKPATIAKDFRLPALGLGKGEGVMGWITFEIPEQAKAGRLKYETEAYRGETLAVGLGAPPSGHKPHIPDVPKRKIPTLPKLGSPGASKGYQVTAVSVQDPAKPAEFYKPYSGRRLVAVEVIFANVSGAKRTVNPLSFQLVASNGIVYEPKLDAVEDRLGLADVSPGEKVQGWVAFEVLEDAKLESIRFVDRYPSLTVQTGLTK